MIFDCHLDLAMNAVHWNRDLTKSLDEIRNRESNLTDKLDRGNGVVCFEEMRKGNIRFCVATQIGHSVSQNSPLNGWNSPEIAWAQTQGQLAWYKEMEKAGHLKPIRNVHELREHRSQLQSNAAIGYILSLEGADSLVRPDYLEYAVDYGLRLIGPAHYGPGRYAAGTGQSDGFTELGFDLLNEIERLNLILDVTHLTDLGFEEAMKCFDGPMIASHHNCRAFVNHQRQLTDDQIKTLVGRGAIIGVALDAWMLVPNWVRGSSTPAEHKVTLELVVDQIDHICQLAGHSNAVAIGSDLDGAFGKEQTPVEIDSIAKLSKVAEVLENRGYTSEAIKNVMCENAFRFFEENLPQ